MTEQPPDGHKKVCHTVKRYRSSPDFRERHKAVMRRRYRSKSSMVRGDCEVPEPPVSRFGAERPVTGLGQRVTFTTEETAQALGCSSAGVVLRWIGAGQLPIRWYRAEVVYPGKGGHMRTMEVDVYLEAEVEVFRQELSKHFSMLRYFRRDHTDVITRIHNRVERLRGGA